MSPTFVKVRNDQGEVYGSYRDYWRLVALANFPTCELSEIDKESTNTYIVSPDNGNVAAVLAGSHTCKFILWQLERPGWVENQVPAHFDEMWVSDRYHKSLIPDDNCKYVTLGGHPDLATGVKGEPEWDFVLTAYIYGKREAQVAALKEQGYTFAPNGYDYAEREYSLNHSRYGLCLHQDEMPIIEPLRYVLYACYDLPIVNEKTEDCFPYRVAAAPNGLSGFEMLLHRSFIPEEENNLAVSARINKQIVTEELTFRKSVEGAL
jgi:hypothetical protein